MGKISTTAIALILLMQAFVMRSLTANSSSISTLQAEIFKIYEIPIGNQTFDNTLGMRNQLVVQIKREINALHKNNRHEEAFLLDNYLKQGILLNQDLNELIYQYLQRAVINDELNDLQSVLAYSFLNNEPLPHFIHVLGICENREKSDNFSLLNVTGEIDNLDALAQNAQETEANIIAIHGLLDEDIMYQVYQKFSQNYAHFYFIDSNKLIISKNPIDDIGTVLPNNLSQLTISDQSGRSEHFYVAPINSLQNDKLIKLVTALSDCHVNEAAYLCMHTGEDQQEDLSSSIDLKLNQCGSDMTVKRISRSISSYFLARKQQGRYHSRDFLPSHFSAKKDQDEDKGSNLEGSWNVRGGMTMEGDPYIRGDIIVRDSDKDSKFSASGIVKEQDGEVKGAVEVGYERKF